MCYKMKNILTFIFLIFLLFLSGCALLDDNRGGYDQKHDTIISNFEQKHEIPDGVFIGRIYAERSTFEAYHRPYYELTRFTFLIGAELFFPEGIGFLLLTPIIAVFETLTLPYSWIRTAMVSQKDINKALEYLQKAREQGYEGTEININGMTIPSTHLDILGYKIKK